MRTVSTIALPGRKKLGQEVFIVQNRPKFLFPADCGVELLLKVGVQLPGSLELLQRGVLVAVDVFEKTEAGVGVGLLRGIPRGLAPAISASAFFPAESSRSASSP